LTAAEYVLQIMGRDELALYEDVIRRAAEAARTWVLEGVGAAMHKYNRAMPSYARTRAPRGGRTAGGARSGRAPGARRLGAAGLISARARTYNVVAPSDFLLVHGACPGASVSRASDARPGEGCVFPSQA